MAYIQFISAADATGELAKWYRRAGNPDGTVDNVMAIHSLNPETLRTHFEMYKAAMHMPSPLPRFEREMAGVAVSQINGCAYCLHHHLEGLKRLLPPERHNAANAIAAGTNKHLNSRETAIVEFASKLTRTPQHMTLQNVHALHDAGLDDRSILDLVQVIGYFNYVNRIVTGLGVRLGDGEGSPGQWPSDNLT